MKNQKICIIGGSLTGLATAISLSKLDCEIDLVMGNLNQNLKSSRTIAISENNFDYLNNLNISNDLKKIVWKCSVLKLYTENKKEKFSEIFEINNENKKEKILYMVENSKLMKLMINKIKQIKSISVKSHKKVSSILDSGLLKSVNDIEKLWKYKKIFKPKLNKKIRKNLINNWHYNLKKQFN